MGKGKAKTKARKIVAPTRDSVDHGTPEIQIKRLAIVGNKAGEDKRLPDPALAAYPLGALMARGEISREQHDMGCQFAVWASHVAGRPNHTASGGSFSGFSDDTDEKMEINWREACRVMRSVSRQAFDAVNNLCFYERGPHDWNRLDQWRDLSHVKRGLTALVEHFGRGNRQHQSVPPQPQERAYA